MVIADKKNIPKSYSALCPTLRKPTSANLILQGDGIIQLLDTALQVAL